MVTYVSSYAQTPITVLPLEVGTTITITAPASVVQGTPFTVSGRLTRNDTGAGIPGQTVYLEYDTTPIGMPPVTDAGGYYSMTAQIDEVGSWYLTIGFYGATVEGLTLGPSSASMRIGLAEVNMLPLLLVAVGAYLLLKK